MDVKSLARIGYYFRYIRGGTYMFAGQNFGIFKDVRGVMAHRIVDRVGVHCIE